MKIMQLFYQIERFENIYQSKKVNLIELAVIAIEAYLNFRKDIIIVVLVMKVMMSVAVFVIITLASVL